MKRKRTIIAFIGLVLLSSSIVFVANILNVMDNLTSMRELHENIKTIDEHLNEIKSSTNPFEQKDYKQLKQALNPKIIKNIQRLATALIEKIKESENLVVLKLHVAKLASFSTMKELLAKYQLLDFFKQTHQKFEKNIKEKTTRLVEQFIKKIEDSTNPQHSFDARTEERSSLDYIIKKYPHISNIKQELEKSVQNIVAERNQLNHLQYIQDVITKQHQLNTQRKGRGQEPLIPFAKKRISSEIIQQLKNMDKYLNQAYEEMLRRAKYNKYVIETIGATFDLLTIFNDSDTEFGLNPQRAKLLGNFLDIAEDWHKLFSATDDLSFKTRTVSLKQAERYGGVWYSTMKEQIKKEIQKINKMTVKTSYQKIMLTIYNLMLNYMLNGVYYTVGAPAGGLHRLGRHIGLYAWPAFKLKAVKR